MYIESEKAKSFTEEEKAAIKLMEKLEKIWPKTLWIYVGDGTLNVMKCNEDGEWAMDGDRVDRKYVVASSEDIPADGGGW